MIFMRLKNIWFSRVIFFAALIFLSWFGSLQAQPVEDVKNIYRQAISFYQQGQFEDAAQAFARVLEMDPAHKGAALYLEKKIPCAINRIEARKRLAQERALEQVGRQRKKQAVQADSFLKKTEAKQNQQCAVTEKKLNDQLTRQIQAKTDQLYKRAVRAYHSKDYKNADTLFKEVLLLNPKHKNAKAYLKKISYQPLPAGSSE